MDKSHDDINDILKINEGRWQNVFVLLKLEEQKRMSLPGILW